MDEYAEVDWEKEAIQSTASCIAEDHQPKYLSSLTIGGEMGIIYQLPIKCPNWWWRMWQWLFCGFKWKVLKKEE